MLLGYICGVGGWLQTRLARGGRLSEYFTAIVTTIYGIPEKNTAVVRLLTKRASAEFSFLIASACLDRFCSKKQVKYFVFDGWQVA